MTECLNCGAPSVRSYCSDACEIADNPDDYPDYDEE
jgi:hypothetical protein